MNYDRIGGVNRYVILTPKDAVIFSEALREAIPTIRFLESSNVKSLDSRQRDVLVARGWEHLVILDPETPDWVPEPKIDPRWPRIISIRNLPRKRLRYAACRWDWFPAGPMVDPSRWAFAFDLPVLTMGRIGGQYCPDYPPDQGFPAFARVVWQVLRRITTNKVKLGHPIGNEIEGGDRLLVSQAKGGGRWVGYHALEWCSAAPRRMLAGHVRPCDDWKTPENDWYRALRARVDERYGPDFGGPPSWGEALEEEAKLPWAIPIYG